jgi:uncharacterized Fe-S cluster-containing radical SAM superfamily protein
VTPEPNLIIAAQAVGKFQHPDWTAKGEPRASVALRRLETLWFNTGTLCNITCRNCYIESSPTNDRLAYISASEVHTLLDEALTPDNRLREIGFTGGEPFLNPEFLTILGDAVRRGPEVLVLTNAMLPMQRPRIKAGLLALNADHGARLHIRVSLDHYDRELHDAERGKGTFGESLKGLDWLAANGFQVAVAGRTCWGEPQDQLRAGFAGLIKARGWPIDAADAHALVLLPEMDVSEDVPEISVGCWDILETQPNDLMCSRSRMIVKRKGAAAPSVVPCTLLPYQTEFDMGATLAAAATADGGMFADGQVKLCHPHCAKFCALGGGSCS